MLSMCCPIADILFALFCLLCIFRELNRIVNMICWAEKLLQLLIRALPVTVSITSACANVFRAPWRLQLPLDLLPQTKASSACTNIFSSLYEMSQLCSPSQTLDRFWPPALRWSGRTSAGHSLTLWFLLKAEHVFSGERQREGHALRLFFL